MDQLSSKKQFWKGYAAGLGTVVLLVLAAVMAKHILAPGSLSFRDNIRLLSKYNTMISIIKNDYLEEIDTDVLIDGAYAGMADAIDDKYSRYFTKEQYEDYLENVTGTFAGIGVTIQWNEETERIKVLSVIEDGPAYQAGILAGDEIDQVEGTPVSELGMDEAVKRIKGPKDTEVTVTVVREGQDPMEMTLTRKLIEEDAATWQMLDGSIGYIQLSGFSGVAPKQFSQAMESLQEEDMKGLILDLRGNPGGQLNAVVEIADSLLPEGLVTYTETRQGQRVEFTSDAETILDVPLVVLIDQDSASASEVLAGALRDHKAGVLVGTTSFGKGIVQTTYNLGDGSALKITMARYYTPNGDFIHGVGIEPDIQVDMEEPVDAVRLTQEDTQFQAALEKIDELIQEKSE